MKQKIQNEVSYSFEKEKFLTTNSYRFLGPILLIAAFQTISTQATTCYCEYDFNFYGYGCVTENVVFLKQSENLIIEGEHFPLDNDATVMHFTIQNSEVRFVPAAILAKYKNLKYLTLNKVQLSDITQTSFANCGLLRELHLEYNDLTTLRKGVFSQCAGLEILYLNNNKISTINKEAFTGLPKLFSLHLEANLYATIPTQTFAPLPKLVTLLIGSINLSAIHPKTFVNNQISSMHIYKSNLTSLHRDLFKGQVKLSTLNILYNPIEKIEPGTLQHLISLSSFMLESSRVTRIEAETFSGLKKLNFLDIGWNKINSIHPDAFIDNVNLEYFYIEENQIKILNGTTLRNNPKIKYIAFGGNWISAIARNFFDSFGSSLRQVSAYSNYCIDKNMQDFSNFTTQVHPYFRKCFKNYDELFPSQAGAEVVVKN